MDGEALYNVSRSYARDLGLDAFCEPWEALGAQEQIHWDQLAAEKELLSRDESASVPAMKGIL